MLNNYFHNDEAFQEATEGDFIEFIIISYILFLVLV